MRNPHPPAIWDKAAPWPRWDEVGQQGAWVDNGGAAAGGRRRPTAPEDRYERERLDEIWVEGRDERDADNTLCNIDEEAEGKRREAVEAASTSDLFRW